MEKRVLRTGGVGRSLPGLRAVLFTLSVLIVSAPVWAGNEIIVNDTSDNTTPGDSQCTLREAIANVNAAGDTTSFDCAAGTGTGDTITFDLTFPATITLTTNSELAVSQNVTIIGPGATQLAIDGNHASRVFEVAGATLTLSKLMIQNGSVTGAMGGGILIGFGGTATLTNCMLSGNSADFGGGGIANHGTATITNCMLSSNSAGYGGGIFSDGTATLTDSTLSHNSADFGGGGIATNGTATLTNSTLSGNTAGYGSGILSAGTATLTGCTLSGNSASDYGGGIFSYGTATLTDCALSHNSAGSSGGGIISYGTATLTDCTLNGNSGGFGGGAISAYGTATLTNCTLNGNSAANGGGGILIGSDATATLTDCTLSDNSADFGGGGIFSYGTAMLTNCTLSGNSADFYGGGILIDSGGAATLTNCTLSGNSADYYGGGIVIYPNGTAALTNTIVANSPSGGDCVNWSGVIDSGHNLIEDAASSCGLTDGMNGDIVGHDPLLGSLADNGGPTLTLALLAGSPGIDAGDAIVCANYPVNGVDQRGYARPGRGITTCSIGAFEYYNLPPDCTAAAASPSTLWPANHDFVNVSVISVTDPEGDPIGITITGIAQDEPLTAQGRADICPDGTGVGTPTAMLRAERAERGDGRVYHVYFDADEGKGGTCSGTVTVCVPRNQGGGNVCVDQGPLVDSTGPCS